MDPRLLSDSVYELPVTYHIRDMRTIKETFRSLVMAKEVMKTVRLLNKVAVVTGGSSGLGKKREGGREGGRGGREGGREESIRSMRGRKEEEREVERRREEGEKRKKGEEKQRK